MQAIDELGVGILDYPNVKYSAFGGAVNLSICGVSSTDEKNIFFPLPLATGK